MDRLCGGGGGRGTHVPMFVSRLGLLKPGQTYTLLQNIEMELVWGAPSPIIFEGWNLRQQTIRRWKWNLSKSPIQFRYRQNILISRPYEQFSRPYEQFSRNDSAMASEKISNL